MIKRSDSSHMIFVTVGTDSPFDRMMKVIDVWAGSHSRNDVFAQIGTGGWQPRHIAFQEFLEPTEYREKLTSAKVIIGHAGMGTILTSLTVGKPVIVMPKLATLGEHRNEHQTATAKHLSKMGKIQAVYTEEELLTQLENIDDIATSPKISATANDALITRIQNFIEQTSPQ